MPAMIYNVSDNADVRWALEAFTATRKAYAVYADYYAGKQRAPDSTGRFTAEFRAFLKLMQANICPAIVAALTDRLKVIGFDGDNGAAWQLWQDRHYAKLANRAHTEAVKSGDAYALVWPDVDGVLRLYPHTPLEMTHRHDPERPEVITLAAKAWREPKFRRLTLYYDDRIERYRAPLNGRYELYNADDDNPAIVRHDYGRVPVWHFAYGFTSGGDDAATERLPHQGGVSALRDVLGLQDAINFALYNRTITMDLLAVPLRVLAGVEGDTDDDPDSPTYGQQKQPIRASADRILTIANKDVQWGEFAAASLAPFNESISADFNTITRITGIPPHYFHIITGDFPSGEAQKTGESRLVARVVDAQTDFGPVWAEIMSFLLRKATDGAALTTLWDDPTSRHERDEVETAAIKVSDLGWSQRRVQEDMGLTEDEIAAMQQQRELEQQAPVEAFGRAFDRV